MVNLKELRIEKKMTQQEVADFVGISLRSYKSYENDKEKQGTIKYNYIVEQLSKINYIDEETGILEPEDIKRKLVEEIRTALHKKVDVLDMNQLKDNIELTEEILKDGIKIHLLVVIKMVKKLPKSSVK